MPKRPYQVAAIPASYFGGPGFETRPVNRIYRRVFFSAFLRGPGNYYLQTDLDALTYFPIDNHKNHFNTTGNVRINAILGRIRVTVMAVEKQ